MRKTDDPTFGGRVAALECVTNNIARVSEGKVGPLRPIQAYHRINAFVLWPGRGLISMNGDEPKKVSVSGREEGEGGGQKIIDVQWGESVVQIDLFLDGDGKALDGSSAFSSKGANSIFFGVCSGYNP